MRTSAIFITFIMIILTGVLLYVIGQEPVRLSQCEECEWPFDQDEEEDAI